MEGKGQLLKWVLLGVAVLLFATYGMKAITGDEKTSELQPLGPPDSSAPPAAAQKAEQLCTLEREGSRFKVQLSTKGASLKHVSMQDEKYTQERDGGAKDPIDLVTTTKQHRMPLRTDFRTTTGDTDQVDYHEQDWKLTSETKSSCEFKYADKKVEIYKRFRLGDGPFELKVEVTLKNLDKEPRKHRLAIEQTDWRTKKETEGSWGRLSEFMTVTEVHTADETFRFETDDFEPADFKEPEFTAEKWHRAPGEALWAAVSSSYFSKAVIHLSGPRKPAGETVIEEIWRKDQFPDKADDPQHGHTYRARLAYPVHELQPTTQATYTFLAYMGPKEREVLAEVGGQGFESTELLDLGMFGGIGKVLIQYLYFLFGITGTWGWAICLLTITVKIVLFPLSISQIKSSMAMRKLKPEMDEINQKYKDDAQQRGLAIQELWRKNKVTNPMLGCLPVLLQMPVWFALYTALQTAVELYHTPFGPWPDLSAPDPYFIIPIVLGGSSFLQQHLMPMQGDAMQQKMMKYMMPGVFTVMMLFLPAGLGIYFMTNTWLSILQQIAVEKYFQRRDKSAGKNKAEADEDKNKDSAKSQAFGKGKKRVQQRG